MPGYWNDKNEWIRSEEAKFSWKKLLSLLQEMPEEKLLSEVVINDGGSETFGCELKEDSMGHLYIKGF